MSDIRGWLDNLAHLEAKELNDPATLDALRGIGRDAGEEIDRLRAALRECANDLEAYVKAQYPAGSFKYPSLERKYISDMEPVRRALKLLGEEQ